MAKNIPRKDKAMTTAQLIAELEKPRKNYPQGVLTWEVGDVAKLPDGYEVLVAEISEDYLEYHGGALPQKTCTHSADDPRVLGQALKALGDTFVSMERLRDGIWDCAYWVDSCEISGEPNCVRGETALEAALRALLAKVEGEQP